MAEEKKVEEKKEEKVVEKQEEEREYTEIEQRAIKMGWNPHWDGDEDDFIDAKEFVRRKPLFDKIEAVTKRQKQTEEALNQLSQHHQKVKEVEYQRALKQIRQEKREALKEGDTTRALELEDKMDELAATHEEEVKVIQQNTQKAEGASKEFLVWVKDNDWYLKDEEMHDFADGVAQSFVKRAQATGSVITENDVFDYVLDKVKKSYPDKFENPNRQRPSAVTSATRTNKQIKSTFKLTDEEESIARNFERMGIMTKDEYIKEIKSYRGEE